MDANSPPSYRPKNSLHGSVSPQSRSGTPLPHIAPSAFFDSIIVPESVGSPLPPMNHGSPGSTSSQDHIQSYESLVAANNQLKTRVAELDLVNDLFRSRVTELENSEANARRSEITRREIEAQLRICVSEGQKREESLKRKVHDLESELKELREHAHQHKKMRLSDMVSDSSPSPKSSS